MSDHTDCKHYDDCDFRNDVGWCPESCNQYKHKDAVIVVRCKDCKRFKPCKEIEGVTWTGFCNYGQFHTDEDDFCSRGERRNDG